jgi:hypothetical protein
MSYWPNTTGEALLRFTYTPGRGTERTVYAITGWSLGGGRARPLGPSFVFSELLVTMRSVAIIRDDLCVEFPMTGEIFRCADAAAAVFAEDWLAREDAKAAEVSK